MRDMIADIGRRRAFYFRDQYRRLVRVCLALLALVSIVFAYVVYAMHTEGVSDTFVTTSLGDLIQLYPETTRANAKVALPEVINDDF